jgi:hypothetical protein
MTHHTAYLPAADLERGSRESAPRHWQPRHRAFLGASLWIAGLSLTLILFSGLPAGPGGGMHWLHQVSPLWGLIGALVAGLLAKLRVREQFSLARPGAAGLLAGLVTLVLVAGIWEWPGGV